MEYGDVVKGITDDVNGRYQGLQKQHHEFANHLNAQVQQLEAHYQQILADAQKHQQQCKQ